MFEDFDTIIVIENYQVGRMCINKSSAILLSIIKDNKR